MCKDVSILKIIHNWSLMIDLWEKDNHFDIEEKNNKILLAKTLNCEDKIIMTYFFLILNLIWKKIW